MIRRTLIKTVLICVGIFLVLSSIALFFIFKSYPIDNERRYSVAVSAMAVNKGTVIDGSMIMMKDIKESALNGYMIQNPDELIGKVLAEDIREGDYITDYRVMDSDNMFADDEKLVAVELPPADRAANIIRKGSYVDIILKYEKERKMPETVLAKVKVEGLTDSAGESVESCAGGRAIYARFKFNKAQRQRLYAAADMGKLYFETYGNEMQKAQDEDFKIPESYKKSR